MEIQTEIAFEVKRTGRGGARPGAGRRAPLGKRVPFTVRVPPQLRNEMLDKAGPGKGALTLYVEGLIKKDLNFVPEDGRVDVSQEHARFTAVGLRDPEPPAPTREITVPAIASERLAQSRDQWRVLQLKRTAAAGNTAQSPTEKATVPTMSQEERLAAERQAKSRLMHGAGTKPPPTRY